MSMTPVLAKIITQRLSGPEWLVILNDWADRLEWVTPINKANHLLSHWCHEGIPGEVVQWVGENQPSSVWTAPTPRPGHTALTTLLSASPQDNSSGATMLAVLLDKKDLDEAADWFLQQEKGYHEKQLFGHDRGYWRGPLGTVAALVILKQYEAAGAYLKRFPEVASVPTAEGWTPGALMCSTEKGWEAYKKSGGSLFSPVHVSHTTDAKDPAGPRPLWLWMMHKKMYHATFRSELISLLTRASEMSAPQTDDWLLSDEDWGQLLDHRKAIRKEMNLLEFERSIDSDWKKAIKSNREWVNWRSSDGANFMHWLAANHPDEFITTSVRVQRNKKLMCKVDLAGNDVVPYLLLGELCGSTSRRRGRRKRFLAEVFRDEMANLVNLKPTHGLLWNLTHANDTAFFGMMKKVTNDRLLASGNGSSIVHGLLAQHPSLALAGLDASWLGHVADHPELAELLRPPTGMLVQRCSSEHQLSDFLKGLPLQVQVLLALTSLCYATSGSEHHPHTIAPLRAAMDQEVVLSSPELSLMINVAKKALGATSSHSASAAAAQEFSAWCENRILTAQVAESEQAPPSALRRRM